MRYQSNEKHEKVLHRVGMPETPCNCLKRWEVTRFQAVWRGYVVRCEHYKTCRAQFTFWPFPLLPRMRDITRFQAKWKGTLTRRRHNVLVNAGVSIQRTYRGRLYGRRPMREMTEAARKIRGRKIHGKMVQKPLRCLEKRGKTWLFGAEDGVLSPFWPAMARGVSLREQLREQHRAAAYVGRL